MRKGATTQTLVDVDLMAAAAAVAATQQRTVTEQINYWARIGMQIERAGSLARRRVLAAAAGEAQFASLSAVEREAAHALIDGHHAEAVVARRCGVDTRAVGHATVSIDDDGHSVEIAPDR
jgi:hypothetical protein